jgi:hypothetical protein
MSTTDTSVDSATDSGSTDPTSTGAAPTDAGASGAVASDTTSSTTTDAGTSGAGSSDAGSGNSAAGSADSAAGSTDSGAGSADSATGSTDSGAGATASGAGTDAASQAGSPAPATGSATAAIDYKAIVAIPSGINDGLTSAGQATMLSAFGNPGTLDPSCGASSAKLQPLMKTANVGPFRVTGFGPAVDALTRVFAAVKSSLPDLYALLGTEGMLCVRLVRGSTTNISNHAWGTAIDITIGGIETKRGSTTVTQGLVSLCTFMHDEQFFWGAGFSPTPDGMHYEASNELITAWKANGTIP